jgi:hypothetical protein
MSDAFRPEGAVPWQSRAAPAPIEDFRATIEAACRHGETVEAWCHRMNTPDDPEAVAFRERWARTPSGRGQDPCP